MQQIILSNASQFPVMYTNPCNAVEETLARLCYCGQKYTNTPFKKLEGRVANMPRNYVSIQILTYQLFY